jgi:hypothetical protein
MVLLFLESKVFGLLNEAICTAPAIGAIGLGGGRTTEAANLPNKADWAESGSGRPVFGFLPNKAIWWSFYF